MDKYVGYIRVSTKRQLKGNGLQIQEKQLRDWEKASKVNIVKIYMDKGLSGFKERPEHKKAIKRVLDDNEIKGIVVPDLSRFGRSVSDLITNIQNIHQKGKNVVSIKEQIELDSAMGQLIFNILCSFAQFERDIINERMSMGREYAKKQGTKFGRPKSNINWKQVKELRKKYVPWTTIAKIQDVHYTTLVRRAKEEGIE